jgi:diadenosine hexaphosphate hydrolase (ATP-forming)
MHSLHQAGQCSVNHVPQAGAVVFRMDGALVRILLVRSRKTPGLWVFPKGHLEAGESYEEAALREAEEEAGIVGTVVGPVGPTLTFQSGDESVAVKYYLVHLTADAASPEGREKVWLAPDEALERLDFQSARDLLRAALREIERQRLA